MCDNHRLLRVGSKVGGKKQLGGVQRKQLRSIIEDKETESNPLITAVSLLASLAPEETIFMSTGNDQKTELNQAYQIWQRQVINALAAIFQIEASLSTVKARLIKAGIDTKNLPKFLQ
jgi:hypothetical protein